MHDLVHDFAQFLTKSECFIMDVDGVAEKYNPVIEKIRHSTFVLAPDAAFPVSTWNGKSLRTLFILGSTNTIINPAIFLHLSSRRTLDLSDCWFKELPEEIERLPIGIARLACLQTVDMFVVARCDKNEALQLGDLVFQDHCIDGNGKEWDKISHIPNINSSD
ncbi:uncharacterized protein LOC126609988 [Malus sylvestris]|uniref:uncharacterized protein LOC126609988 n=1 Tax=Malus sylvestris TaxID=3752 RepID=UPI0021ABAE72|nr:uncharacterized protein LOC126609988 [Malus sylvestris]